MLLKAIKYTLLSLLALIIGFLLVLMIRYSPTYVFRLLWLNTADVYDYTYFENRLIQASEEPFHFHVQTDEKYVENLFADEIMYSGFNDFEEWVEKSKTTALLFIRRDTVLYERYFNGFERDSYFHSQSMAKSFISTLIGFAIQDGYISHVNDPITKYIPELLDRDAQFEKMTIRHLLMMCSGVKYNEAFLPLIGIHAPWHDEAVGYYHPNVRKLLLERVEMDKTPGAVFQYCNYNTSYLGLILERVTHKSVSEYLEEKLWTKMGTEYDALFSVDNKSDGFEYMPSRLMARAIDYAKFGRLFLQDGSWNNEQVISPQWVQEATREDTTIRAGYYPQWMRSGPRHLFYKYQWWGHTNGEGTFQFFASGNLGQSIYVIPHRDIIIVHCGNSNAFFNPDDLWHIERVISYSDFNQMIADKGVKAGIESFHEKQKDNPDYLPFDEHFVNAKGYAYLKSGRVEEALLLFALNVSCFPHSANVYDSMGEAYSAKGELKLAAEFYSKSLEINPGNHYAKDQLKEITHLLVKKE